jgi:hypothetical protein
MKAPTCASICGVVGLSVFGVAYDTGLFGTPDGFDHSAPVKVPVLTPASTTATVATSLFSQGHDTITGAEFTAPLQPITDVALFVRPRPANPRGWAPGTAEWRVPFTFPIRDRRSPGLAVRVCPEGVENIAGTPKVSGRGGFGAGAAS